MAYLREKFARLRQQRPGQKHLMIIAQGISFVDIAAADVLAAEAELRRANGGGLYLVNVKAGLWESLEECHALDKINSHNVFQSKSAALHGVFHKMDKSRCAGCTARIFRECAGVPLVSDTPEPQQTRLLSPGTEEERDTPVGVPVNA